MKCPICKKTIPDDSLKCPHCKARTGLICKSCHTVNSVSDIVCKKCGEEILKLCPECNCVNFPNTKKCRKCGFEFKDPTIKHRIESKNANINLDEQNKRIVNQELAIQLLEKTLLSRDKKIISLSGNRGVGKSHVLAQVIQNLHEKQFLWFYGKCSPITQLTPGGLLQDILFNLFDLPNFCINSQDFKKNATKLFQNKFPYLNSVEILDFLNFLYPAEFGMFEDILPNKAKTFDLLNKIFDKIIQYTKFVIVVDNFEAIDGFSYEFLHNYIKKTTVLKDLKLLLIYTEAKPCQGYFNISEKDEMYFDITLSNFNAEEMLGFLAKKEERNVEFPKMKDSEKTLILAQSKGIAAYIEQASGLRMDCQIADCEFDLPESYTNLVAKRICILSEINKEAYTLLMGSAILGDKINLNLMRQIFNYEDKILNDIITYLNKMNFITPLNEIFYQFKDLLLWETILNVAKTDNQYIELNTKICNALVNFTPNSNAIFGIIAQNIKNPELALDIWTRNTRLASYIGDINLYNISQKQCLALVNELDDRETLKIRYNISERLGKLLTDFNPKDAMEYLPDAIANAESIGNTPKEIELLGYMTNCCRKTRNYLGNIECVDAVLSKINPDKKLEIAMIKCTKLNALLALGNCGQVINIIDNEIMPVFKEVMNSNYTGKGISGNLILETWLKVQLILAEALVTQGNDRVFEILTTLYDTVEKNNITDTNFICKCKLILAQANSMKGDYETSEKLLEDLMKLDEKEKLADEIAIKWNFINIFNNFMRKRYKNMQEDLFYIVTFANNCGDNFTKNIMKTMLGKVLCDTENVKRAMPIYQEQITYFSKEKMALGALLTWYLIADGTLSTNDPYEAQEIASQAIEVAKNPKIDNYFFTVLLEIVIAKSFMAISDYDSAKIHIEQGLSVAKKYNMNDLLSRLYLLYGKYLNEIGTVRSGEQMDYLEGSKKMYKLAEDLVRQTKNNIVHVEIEKSKNILLSFTRMNGIKL